MSLEPVRAPCALGVCDFSMFLRINIRRVEPYSGVPERRNSGNRCFLYWPSRCDVVPLMSLIDAGSHSCGCQVFDLIEDSIENLIEDLRNR